MTFRSFVLLAGVLACAVALAGFIIGWRVSTLTESDVIEAAAARYVADHKGAPEQCEARPGTPPVWITVLCGSPDVTAIYQSDRFGRLTESPAASPQTAATTE